MQVKQASTQFAATSSTMQSTLTSTDSILLIPHSSNSTSSSSSSSSSSTPASPASTFSLVSSSCSSSSTMYYRTQSGTKIKLLHLLNSCAETDPTYKQFMAQDSKAIAEALQNIDLNFTVPAYRKLLQNENFVAAMLSNEQLKNKIETAVTNSIFSESLKDIINNWRILMQHPFDLLFGNGHKLSNSLKETPLATNALITIILRSDSKLLCQCPVSAFKTIIYACLYGVQQLSLEQVEASGLLNNLSIEDTKKLRNVFANPYASVVMEALRQYLSEDSYASSDENANQRQKLHHYFSKYQSSVGISIDESLQFINNKLPKNSECLRTMALNDVRVAQRILELYKDTALTNNDLRIVIAKYPAIAEHIIKHAVDFPNMKTSIDYYATWSDQKIFCAVVGIDERHYDQEETSWLVGNAMARAEKNNKLYYALGRYYQNPARGNEITAAIACFENAAKAGMTAADFELGMLYKRNKDFNQAIACFDKVIAKPLSSSTAGSSSSSSSSSLQVSSQLRTYSALFGSPNGKAANHLSIKDKANIELTDIYLKMAKNLLKPMNFAPPAEDDILSLAEEGNEIPAADIAKVQQYLDKVDAANPRYSEACAYRFLLIVHDKIGIDDKGKFPQLQSSAMAHIKTLQQKQNQDGLGKFDQELLKQLEAGKNSARGSCQATSGSNAVLQLPPSL
jgi:hypothetical protein